MNKNWPELDYASAKETYLTLQLFTQIAGKVKVALLPWQNHSWHVTLLVTPLGFTTGPLPATTGYFQIDFDFRKHELQINTSQGESRQFGLQNRSVASFYRQLFDDLKSLDITCSIYPVPNELEKVIPFPKDESHATYQPEEVKKLHQALLLSQDVLASFRAGFSGKSSPVHFFWGSFDLAVSRFSGRKAPLHPGGVPHLPDRVVQEAYSHEVSSCGFWPGNEAVPYAAFYAYHYPEPENYKTAAVKPAAAFYHPELREFILPYAEVQKATDPAAMLQEFLESTYAAAAELANWPKADLEFTYKK